MASNMSDLTRQLQPVMEPITEQEEAQARKSVASYMDRQSAERRYRILGAELRIDKAPPDTVPPRRIGVLVVDYGNKRNLDFLLDGEGEVIKVDDYPGARAVRDEEIAH